MFYLDVTLSCYAGVMQKPFAASRPILSDARHRPRPSRDDGDPDTPVGDGESRWEWIRMESPRSRCWCSGRSSRPSCSRDSRPTCCQRPPRCRSRIGYSASDTDRAEDLRGGGLDTVDDAILDVGDPDAAKPDIDVSWAPGWYERRPPSVVSKPTGNSVEVPVAGSTLEIVHAMSDGRTASEESVREQEGDT